ncbi:hypothetical protein DFH11DRAFT_1745109 [Phellopilus nigrolimitatus]|nr:hypothetical protein DFH11DRAFT_1745109 [Phellopilus nigrolimitatus]
MHSIRSDVEPVDPSLVPLFITEIVIEQYALVAVLTLLVYDTVITMDKEVKYFWNRYIGFLGAILLIECIGLYWIQGLANWMTVLLIDYILLMRVLALYHQNKRLAAFLRTLFGLDAAFTLGIPIYITIYVEIVVLDLGKGVTLCGANRNPPKAWAALSWAASMLYGIILMVLALYKAAEHWRETAGFSQFTLVKVLIQDQAIYFIMVIFCSIIEITANQLYIPNPLLANFLNVLGSPSLLCVLGSHLLVHLKEAGERGVNGGTSYRMQTMSDIEFS